jgi:carbon-monoxide dehydrogenase medium subunit
VRNVATLGGNVAHALPAADGTIALVALGAQAEIVNQDGLRKMPFLELFLGPGISALDKSNELISGFYIPIAKSNQASAFNRIMRPQGVALPILNCAVWLERDGQFLRDIRIAVGPGGPRPFRGTQAENKIRGGKFTDDLIEDAFTELQLQGSFRTSPHRATSDYRRHILKGLFRDTFKTAWIRANG